MNIQWIVAPVVGAVIGYITNWIAIKMLFRPFEAVYLWGWHVPFTPGLIPKEQGRLAASMGAVISRELLNEQSIKDALLSDGMRRKIAEGADQIERNLANDERSIGEAVGALIGEDRLDSMLAQGQDKVAIMLTDKLLAADIGSLAGQAIADHFERKSPSLLRGLISGLVDDKFKQNITKQLSDGINDYLVHNGKDKISEMIGREADKLRDKRIAELVAGYEDRWPELRDKLMQGYEQAVIRSAKAALDAIDLSSIVRSQIENFDAREIEVTVFEIMGRELSAVMALGGLLGFIMGFTNLLIG